MTATPTHPRIYDGDIDAMLDGLAAADRIRLLPDEPSLKQPDLKPKMRLMWGQHLLDDLVAGRYRSLVCAVNADDNSRGIIAQIADALPTSQWTPDSITRHAATMVQDDRPIVIKVDMDLVEVLAILRPRSRDHLTLDDLAAGFTVVGEMLRARSQRRPAAAVSFLGARMNKLVGPDGDEPSFETVLRTMHDAGFPGDVYPAPSMWEAATGVFARYPFPDSVGRMREGGY